MKNKLILTTACLFLSTAFIHCGQSGGSTSGEQRLLLIDMSDNMLPDDNLSANLTTEILTNSDYRYVMDITEASGTTLAENLDVLPYNESDQVYFSQIELESNKQYTAKIRLIKNFSANDSWAQNLSTESTINTLILSQLDVAIDTTSDIIEVSASESSWDQSFDDDEDGLFNLEELNRNSNPFLTDTDGDGTNDLDDDFPTDASENLDTDSDGIGETKDNCPATSNASQTDEDNDGLGDECDEDADNDTITNTQDNCPTTANANQSDLDDDTLGDDCDDDRDGDTLSNDQEVMAGTNADQFDSDGDTVGDATDSFPNNSSEYADDDQDLVGNASDNCMAIANPNQINTDSDLFGDACDTDDDNDGLMDITDNCPTTLAALSLTGNFDEQTDVDADGYGTPCDCADSNDNINPSAEDKPDLLVQDTNCDGIDGDLANSIRISPADDFAAAFNQAQELGYDIYLSSGTHTFTDIEISSSIGLYGGFSSDFSQRISSPDSGNETIVKLQSSSPQLANDPWIGISLSGENTTATLSSLAFQTDSDASHQVMIDIDGGNVTLEALRFDGNPNSSSETFIQGTSTNIEASNLKFEAQSSDIATGLNLMDSTGSLINSVINMNTATHTSALLIEDSEFSIINNTIDGGSHSAGTAFGIEYENSVLDIINNIIITDNSVLQASIRCDGAIADEPSIVRDNLFLRYSQTNSYIYPAYISCNSSKSYLSTTSQLESPAYSSEIVAQNNLVDNRTTQRTNSSQGLGTLLDSEYRIIETTSTYIRNQGENTSVFGVTSDMDNQSRDTNYDRGADEI